jgi:hypothetical protein
MNASNTRVADLQCFIPVIRLPNLALIPGYFPKWQANSNFIECLGDFA